MNIEEYADQYEDEAIKECDELMHDFVDSDDVDEYGSVYEAYCELCNGEAESEVCRNHAVLFTELHGGDVAEIMDYLQNAWFYCRG